MLIALVAEEAVDGRVGGRYGAEMFDSGTF
jgi:hypothetical protein